MSGGPPHSAASAFWPDERWTSCRSAYQAAGIEPLLRGRARWLALAALALQDCFGSGSPPSPGTPLLLASCNGAADGFEAEGWRQAFDSKELLKGIGWARRGLPVLSASCNSGLHALYLARQLLLAGYADEVTVLAVDTLSRASHDNFEVLRVLSDTPQPWQAASSGFTPGEAAVALHLARAEDSEAAPQLKGPALASDLEGHDGLSAVLSELRPERLKLILGQGTGPFQSDALELAALGAVVGEAVPLATPLACFGHTLGASSLLSVALAALAWRAQGPLPVLAMHAASALDGRPLFKGSAGGDEILITCRAMSGACGAASVGTSKGHYFRPARGWRSDWRRGWRPACPPGPLMHPVLRQIGALASGHRPVAPPDVLLVRMDEPLLPHERASIGGRLLPSAVLEMTPGFVSQLIARCWGFTGGAFCLVGDAETDESTARMVEACRKTGLTVCRINLRGGVDERAIEWNA